jgi:hypothetical protein
LWSCAAGERDDIAAVGDRQHARLLADESLLDDQLAAGGAEFLVAGDPLHRFEGLGLRIADDHPFAGGETVGFHHHRLVFAFDEVGSGAGGVAEGAEIGRGDVGVAEEVLAEDLARFELGGLLARPERLDAGGAHRVDDAGGQRRLGADDGQVDGVVLGELHQRGDVGIADGDVLSVDRRAGIAGGDEDAFDPRALFDFPGEGVFASAAADNHDLHRTNSCAASALGQGATFHFKPPRTPRTPRKSNAGTADGR